MVHRLHPRRRVRDPIGDDRGAGVWVGCDEAYVHLLTLLFVLLRKPIDAISPFFTRIKYTHLFSVSPITYVYVLIQEQKTDRPSPSS